MALSLPGLCRADEEPGAPQFRIAAVVDKTAVDVGAPITLTITIEGELNRSDLQPFEFPKSFQVVAQSRASNVSLQMGRMKRSLSLNYVLIPREAGTFQLGPFQATSEGKPVSTDPIDIVVNKPVLPPSTEEQPRLTL